MKNLTSYREWKQVREGTTDPVTNDNSAGDDTEATEEDKLFYKGQYSGIVGPLLTRLSGAILGDSRFNRPSIKGLLLQDIVLALGLNQDIGLFTRIANRIRTELNAAENPASLPFNSPALKRAYDKRGMGVNDMDQSRPATPPPTSQRQGNTPPIRQPV